MLAKRGEPSVGGRRNGLCEYLRWCCGGWSGLGRMEVEGGSLVIRDVAFHLKSDRFCFLGFVLGYLGCWRSVVSWMISFGVPILLHLIVFFAVFSKSSNLNIRPRHNYCGCWKGLEEPLVSSSVPTDTAPLLRL